MMCLTVCQPYATWIIHGLPGKAPKAPKEVENRTRPTTYRGPLAIHAGKSTSYLLDPVGHGDWKLPRGFIIGVVDLVECLPIDRYREHHGGDYAERFGMQDPHAHGPWCWVLRNPRPCKPAPLRGQLGLFEINDALIVNDPPS